MISEREFQDRCRKLLLRHAGRRNTIECDTLHISLLSSMSGVGHTHKDFELLESLENFLDWCDERDTEESNRKDNGIIKKAVNYFKGY